MAESQEKLVCIRQGADYYRTTQAAAAGIIRTNDPVAEGETIPLDAWRYTTKNAWRGHNGKYIPTPTFTPPGQ